MIYFLSAAALRSEFLTDSERLLCAGIIVAGLLQLAKFFLPLLNGWVALGANVLLSIAAMLLVLGFNVNWNSLAVAALIALAAAGIHGTATKISDYPDPHENPTPSGTPAQNYGRMVDNR